MLFERTKTGRADGRATAFFSVFLAWIFLVWKVVGYYGTLIPCSWLGG